MQLSRTYSVSLWCLCVSVVCSAPSSAQAQEPTPGSVAVQHAFLREEFDSVTTLAASFLSEHLDAPEKSRVWIWLILSLDRLQRAQEALGELDRLKARLPVDDPLHAEVLFWEGDISRRALLTVRAKLAYQRLLERYPDSTWATQAQMGLGLVYLHQQAFDTAQSYFHEVVLRHTGTPAARDALLLDGICQLQLKRFAEALSLFDTLAAQVNDDAILGAQLAFYRGESLTGLTRYAEAMQTYERAITLDPTSNWASLAQFGLGWAHYQAGRCRESLDAFARYLDGASERASSPSASASRADYRTEGLFAQGSCLIQLGREEEAFLRFQEVLKRNPTHPLALESGLLMVDIYRRNEQFQEAKTLLHQLLRQPLDQLARAKVQIRLGSVALDQGNATQAKTIFQLANAIHDPTVHQASLSGLGDVAVFVGEMDQAKQYYEQAIMISDQTPLASSLRYQLGRIHLQLGHTDEAIAIFQQLVTGNHPVLADDAKLALALAYLSQDYDAAARMLLETLRRQRPGSVSAARAAYYLALLAVGGEEEELARTLCEETLERAPRSEEAVDARLLLAEILAERTSDREAIAWLGEAYRSTGLLRRHRAKLAKRIADLARLDRSYVEAIRWYETAMELIPTFVPEATYWLASCYEAQGDASAAMKTYQRVTQSPWRMRARLAMAKLLERDERLQEAEAIYQELASESGPEATAFQERLEELREARHIKERGW